MMNCFWIQLIDFSTSVYLSLDCTNRNAYCGRAVHFALYVIVIGSNECNSHYPKVFFLFMFSFFLVTGASKAQLKFLLWL